MVRGSFVSTIGRNLLATPQRFSSPFRLPWRHFFNMPLRMGNVADSKVRTFTGHKSETMTELYTHFDPRESVEVRRIQEDIVMGEREEMAGERDEGEGRRRACAGTTKFEKNTHYWGETPRLIRVIIYAREESGVIMSMAEARCHVGEIRSKEMAVIGTLAQILFRIAHFAGRMAVWNSALAGKGNLSASGAPHQCELQSDQGNG